MSVHVYHQPAAYPAGLSTSELRDYMGSVQRAFAQALGQSQYAMGASSPPVTTGPLPKHIIASNMGVYSKEAIAYAPSTQKLTSLHGRPASGSVLRALRCTPPCVPVLHVPNSSLMLG